MVTAYNILAIAKSRLHLLDDSYLDEILLDEAKRGYNMFINRQTYFEQDYEATVCEKVVSLPCKASDITSLRFYDTSDTEVFPLFVARLTEENFRFDFGFQYFFNGETIEFFSEDYDGYKVCIRYKGKMRNSDGEVAFPDEYEDGLSSFVCYSYYAFHADDIGGANKQENQIRAREFKQRYMFEAQRLTGASALLSVPEQVSIQHLTNSVGHKNLSWWNGGIKP